MVARSQLVELGFGRQAILRRVQAHRLRRLHRGVYAVGQWPLSPQARDMAAVLACGPAALLSHRSAAAAWQLLRTNSARIEVTAARGCKPKAGVVVHVSRLVHTDDRSLVDGIPVTSVARTLVDLADVVDERRLTAAVNEAEVLRLFDLARIEATLARLPGRRGRHRLARVLAAYTEVPGYSVTEAERLFLRICADNGLPPPQRIFVAGYELDFYWPDARLAVEIDGGAFHRTRRAFHEDRRRDRRLGALGIQVARVPWLDLTLGERALVAELKAMRRRRAAVAPAARGLPGSAEGNARGRTGPLAAKLG